MLGLRGERVPGPVSTERETIAARAYPAADQTIATATLTTVTLGTEDYDIGSNFATNTFTAPIAGYYLVTGRVHYAAAADNKRYWAVAYKNGTTRIAEGIANGQATAEDAFPCFADIVKLAVGDTLVLATYHDQGTNSDINNGGDTDEAQTALAVHLLSI